MAAARITAIALFLMVSVLAAQNNQQTTLKLQVQDASGACIPGAMIQVQSKETSRELKARSDENGELTLSLDPGGYRILVSAQAFKTWSSSINLELHKVQLITASLPVSSYSGPIIVNPVETGPKPDRSVPDEAISAIPLASIALPAHRLHVHMRSL